MIINDAFTVDTDKVRTERLLLLSANIDTYAAGLGIVDPKLTECQDANTDWTEAATNASVENGEALEATELLNNGLATAYDYYMLRQKKYYSQLSMQLVSLIKLLKSTELRETHQGILQVL